MVPDGITARLLPGHAPSGPETDRVGIPGRALARIGRIGARAVGSSPPEPAPRNLRGGPSRADGGRLPERRAAAGRTGAGLASSDAPLRPRAARASDGVLRARPSD